MDKPILQQADLFLLSKGEQVFGLTKGEAMRNAFWSVFQKLEAFLGAKLTISEDKIFEDEFICLDFSSEQHFLGPLRINCKGRLYSMHGDGREASTFGTTLFVYSSNNKMKTFQNQSYIVFEIRPDRGWRGLLDVVRLGGGWLR